MVKPGDSRCLETDEFVALAGFSDKRLDAVRAVAKRAFDFIAAFSILAVISPAMLVIWAMVRMDSGPSFYGHLRVGRGNREFRCLKFRTMAVNADVLLKELLANDMAARAEWERSRKLVADPRVTRIGRILRATSLDELPQLFNVLRGDMSLVGPRPVVRAELDKYYIGAYQLAYFSLRPGLTGLWQISGRSDSTYDQRVRLDGEYAQRASLRRDLKILWRTVGVVLKRRGAY